MENRQQQILSEIKSMMASVRSQLEMLDTKMAELQQIVDPEDFAAESVDIDIEIEETPETAPVEVVTVQEIPLEEPVETVEEISEEPVAPSEDTTVEEIDDDLPFAEAADEPAPAEAAEESVPEPVDDEVHPEPEDGEDLPEPAVEDLPAPTIEEDLPAPAIEEDLPAPAIEEDIPESIFGDPEPVTVAAKVKATTARPTINDMMADTCAWRHDMPGAPVRDIRSAISLNDRVIFINLLFEEDAQTFVNTLAQINTMETLDQAVEYITAQFPSWDMNSDLVYRFMMAVRRKVK